MSFNPYSPPLATLDIPPAPEGSPPRFFAVAPWKLLLMCLVTVGLYQMFWFYKNWVAVRRHERSAILPAARAFFGVFYCYALFSRIRERGMAEAVPKPPAAGWLALAWVVANLAWRLPGTLCFLGMFSWFAMLPMQVYANAINSQAAPGSDRNARLSALNWVAVVLGGGFFALMVVGVLAGRT